MLAFLEGPDLIIVAVVVLLLFGGSQLPKLARSLGQAKKELDLGLHEGATADPAPSVAAGPAAEPVVVAAPVAAAPVGSESGGLGHR